MGVDELLLELLPLELGEDLRLGGPGLIAPGGGMRIGAVWVV